jgi:hypothetical protein
MSTLCDSSNGGTCSVFQTIWIPLGSGNWGLPLLRRITGSHQWHLRRSVGLFWASEPGLGGGMPAVLARSQTHQEFRWGDAPHRMLPQHACCDRDPIISDSIPPIACLGGWWLGTSPPQKPRSEMKACLLMNTNPVVLVCLIPGQWGCLPFLSQAHRTQITVLRPWMLSLV